MQKILYFINDQQECKDNLFLLDSTKIEKAQKRSHFLVVGHLRKEFFLLPLAMLGPDVEVFTQIDVCFVLKVAEPINVSSCSNLCASLDFCQDSNIT